jgi:hypothetical protein
MLENFQGECHKQAYGSVSQHMYVVTKAELCAPRSEILLNNSFERAKNI